MGGFVMSEQVRNCVFSYSLDQEPSFLLPRSSLTAKTYFFQSSDFGEVVGFARQIYDDLLKLSQRLNIKFSKGFRNKVSQCSSEILSDFENKIRHISVITDDFLQLFIFIKDNLTSIQNSIKQNLDPSEAISFFFQEFFRRFQNLELDFYNKLDVLSLDIFRTHRHKLHEGKLNASYLSPLEGFYDNLHILTASLQTFFQVQMHRSIHQTDRGLIIRFDVLLSDMRELIIKLASTVIDAEAAARA